MNKWKGIGFILFGIGMIILGYYDGENNLQSVAYVLGAILIFVGLLY